MKTALQWLSWFALLSAVAPPVLAQSGTKPGLRLDPDAKVTVAARFEPATARAGETVKLIVGATVADSYHAYGSREEVQEKVALRASQLKLGALERVGDAVVPPGSPKEFFGSMTYPLPQYFEVTQMVKVPAGTAVGEIEAKGTLDYQVCDENSCDPPADVSFAATLTVEAGEARAEHSGAAPVEVVVPPVDGGKSETAGAGEASAPKNTAPAGPLSSWWALILACIGGGLFALAMPCTYPMIPITFSFFTKQAEKRGGNVLSLALIYGFGIIAMFAFVGVALSTAIIPIVNHWATNLVIGVMFLFFAFVLFGWVNLNPPRFMQDAAGKASGTGGLLGVFLMGATLVITSFTCTAPIVGSLIANVAQYGQTRVGIGMAIFGLTMAIPFVFLALMPTKVKAMPRSGEWMETLKISLGFVELAATLKFLSAVDLALGWAFLNRELFLFLTAAILLMWAMYLFGILRKAGTPSNGVGAGRMATGMFVVLFSAYLLFGAMGYRLDFYTTSFAPGYSAELVISRGGGGHENKSHALVYDNPIEAMAVAKAHDKLLLYNFTGFN